MFSRLPSEIVHRILSQPGLCTVRDEVFTESYTYVLDKRRVLDRSRVTRILGASYLLVCKTWLQVGTPLVYETVVLNCQSQADAFRNTLIANPNLGLLVRKLRIHRCFGEPARVILLGCPRITDLYLSLTVGPQDQVHDLAVSLEVIRPTRAIVHDPFHMACDFPEPLGRLYKALHDSIHNWRSLVSSLLRSMPHTANSLVERVPFSMLLPWTASARNGTAGG
jgi:hypothetical protein